MFDIPSRAPWSSVLQQLQQSLFAEEMVCAMSSQLFHIPATQDLKGNREMHQHLVPASYHRVTAVGSAYRLSAGEYQESIVATMVSCIQSATNQDREIKKWLFIMNDAAPQEYKPFIGQIIQWQNQAEFELTSAKRILTQQGLYSQQQGQSGSYSTA
jgi:hypothetical protein